MRFGRGENGGGKRARTVRELVDLGARFNMAGAGKFDFAMGREGGHSVKRIIHAHDLTGREIEDALVAKAREDDQITILEDHVAVNLITFSSSVRSGILVTQYETSVAGPMY